MPGVSEDERLKWENENLRRFAHEQAARMGDLQREIERLAKDLAFEMDSRGRWAARAEDVERENERLAHRAEIAEIALEELREENERQERELELRQEESAAANRLITETKTRLLSQERENERLRLKLDDAQDLLLDRLKKGERLRTRGDRIENAMAFVAQACEEILELEEPAAEVADVASSAARAMLQRVTEAGLADTGGEA